MARGLAGALVALGLLVLLRLAFSWVGILLGLMVRCPEAAMEFLALLSPLTMAAGTVMPADPVPG